MLFELVLNQFRLKVIQFLKSNFSYMPLESNSRWKIFKIYCVLLLIIWDSIFCVIIYMCHHIFYTFLFSSPLYPFQGHGVGWRQGPPLSHQLTAGPHVSILGLGTSVVLRRCPGTSLCYQTLGLESWTLQLSAHSPTDWATTTLI